MRLVIGTNNEGKLKEFRQMFSKIGIDVVSLNQLGIDIDVEEDGETFEENSLKKAKEICNITGQVSIADDSGLMVDFLDGAPGVFSKRYFGEGLSEEQRNHKLLKMLDGVPYEKRNAKFVSVISVVFPDGKVITSRGECDGFILQEPQGDSGFGYDPLFYYPPFDKTYANMTKDEKNSISHRGVALCNLIEEIKLILK